MTNPQQTEGLTAEQHIIHDALDDLYYGKCAGERLEVCYDAVSNFIKASRQDQSSLIKVLTEALEEFSREYDGFEDGMGEPCPTLAKARSALSMAKEGN